MNALRKGLPNHPLLSMCVGLAGVASLAAPASAASNDPGWEPCGWGGGGFYYAAAFHPSRNGVIYLGGDVGGLYKSEDFGRTWRMINNGIAGYGVFTLAVDRSNPDTVYAATADGLCKSVDAGKNWTTLPQTGPKELRITGEKNKSIRSVAVDPADGKYVYAGSPAGRVFRSVDGGQTWIPAFAKTTAADPTRLRVQYGKNSGAFFGGIWMPVKCPEGVAAADVVGFGFNFQGDGSTPKDCFLALQTADGFRYRSVNLNHLFADVQAKDVTLKAADFIVDPEYAKKNPDAAIPPAPEFAKVVRLDLSCSGALHQEQYVASLGSFYFAALKSPAGESGTADRPVLLTVREFSKDKAMQSYGNIKLGEPAQGPVYSVAISPKNPSLVIAATDYAGLVMSRDRGETWTELPTPKRASNVAFDPSNADVIYGTFFADGIWKSADQGKTWSKIQTSLPAEAAVREVVVHPHDSQRLYAIAKVGWGGHFVFSKDGGATWTDSSKIKADYQADPTLPLSGEFTPLSIPTNLAINPNNPEQLYISANWRCAFSGDGGATWEERIKGADISCITDIRFSGDRTYVTAMDEGTLVSDDNGQTWRQLWPLKHDIDLSGHNWRVAVNTIGGADRIISTASPWDSKFATAVVVSEDGGKTFKRTTTNLPAHRITANTMWDRGYPRALAVDPANPKIAYLGLDGDPAGGKEGGGIFKTEDGGHTWNALPNQPSSRRMFFGLAIDPTNPKRIYWAAFANNGGVHMSEDGGASWNLVFKGDQYLFNLITLPDGTVYASGKQLYRSTDHGKTWKTLTQFTENRSIVGIEVHPKNPNTIWISAVVWSGKANGAVYKSVDGGVAWNDITGNLPFIQPQVLRFNPRTNELWAGNVGLYRIRQ